jgi:hypothetical protein
MPPVCGMAAESSANARAPQRTMSPPTTQTASMRIGSGTRVAMLAGLEAIAPPIVMLMTIPTERQTELSEERRMGRVWFNRCYCERQRTWLSSRRAGLWKWVISDGLEWTKISEICSRDGFGGCAKEKG